MKSTNRCWIAERVLVPYQILKIKRLIISNPSNLKCFYYQTQQIIWVSSHKSLKLLVNPSNTPQKLQTIFHKFPFSSQAFNLITVALLLSLDTIKCNYSNTLRALHFCAPHFCSTLSQVHNFLGIFSEQVFFVKFVKFFE